ncbi:MAG TPA: hypothetical protein PLI23_11530, partial [Thermoclostridium caenicola]|uniref:hypothetical protein n=1 Tax=Thermoclostridium caenicola TaxID=659425 RepID=UPI002B873E42
KNCGIYFCKPEFTFSIDQNRLHTPTERMIKITMSQSDVRVKVPNNILSLFQSPKTSIWGILK